MLKMIVDENIPAAETCFATLGEVVKKPGRSLQPADVRDADVLIVRSITQVDQALLHGSKVRFVGTATIGVDHVDQAYLTRQGIFFTNAPGCNAQSVVDYVMAALLDLEASRGIALEGKTIGIIGVGNVGARLRSVAKALGLKVRACDPPLQQQGVTGLVSADEAWQADIVSLHVPFERDGPYPTLYLGDYARLHAMAPGAVLINTARGAVIDNRALSNVLHERSDLCAVLDVWDGEPLVDRELASQVDIATPHIAGYSYDGKVRGTWMIYQKLCEFLQQPVTLQEADLIAPQLSVLLDFSSPHTDDPLTALDIVRKVYDIREDDLGLRSSLQRERERRGEGFDALRKYYRVRREFATVRLRGCEYLRQRLPLREWQRLVALGFRDEHGAPLT